MKNLKMKAPVLFGLCIILTVVFASSAVYAGNNPPPGGYHWQGPAVLAKINFRPVKDADRHPSGPCTDPDGTIISGTISCMNYHDYPIPLSGGAEYYGYCINLGEPFANVTEEGLVDFFVKQPHTDELIEPDCIPYDKTDGDLENLQVNVVNNFTVNPDGSRTADLILLFLNPK
jgi:hypothetical protein